MNASPVTSPAGPPKAVLVPAVIGLVIAIAVTFVGPLESAGERAPYGLLGGASFALGGVLGWLAMRWKNRS